MKTMFHYVPCYLSADNGGHGQRGRRRTSECGQWGLQPDAGVAFELSTPNGGDDPFALHAMRLTALCLKNIYENIHAALVVAITHSST